MKRYGILLLAVVVLFASACDRRPEGAQEPRFPDEEGVVTEVDLSRIVLDGNKTFEISPEVQSFSTYNRTVIPLLTWEGKYVHIGLDDKTVVWIAGIGPVDTSQNPPLVYYTNSLYLEKRGSSAIFLDGTVLRLAEGVEVPPSETIVKATIDPAKHAVIDLFWEEKQNAE